MSVLPRRLLSLALIIALLVPAGFAEADPGTAFGDGFIALDGTDVSVSEVPYEPDETYAHEAVLDSYAELKRGDRDEEDSSAVLTLQTRLKDLGYLNGTPDGVFGEDTEVAIAEFQTNNNLPRNGVADQATMALLYGNADVARAGEINTETDIYRTQKMLSQWGFLEEDPDGRQGSNTNKAIIRFKEYVNGDYLRRNPLPTPEPTATPAPTESTGYGDAAIVEDVLLHPDVEYTDAIDLELLNFVDGIYTFNPFTQKVGSGDGNDEVDRVQRRLHQLKYQAIIDGQFGSATTRALLYFQKVNGLDQTGVADETTQRRLFSEEAVATEEYVNPYKIYVDISDQRVYVFQWDGSGYGIPLKKFICSTGLKGKETETPTGTFSAGGPSGTGQRYYFKKYNCYAKWGYFIVGGIMFHSVTYNKKKKLIEGSRSNLGRRASHGCIRLEIENAKWIYDNCPAGTTVVIQD